MVSPARVASRYLDAAPFRYPQKVKTTVNLTLIKAGFDGNGRFKSPGDALNRIGTVLSAGGLEWGEVINSFPLRQPRGRMNIALALSNPEDPFSPTDLPSTALAFQWYQLEGGAYEVVAYLS